MKILSDLLTVRFLLLFLGFTAALTVTSTPASAQTPPHLVLSDGNGMQMVNGGVHDFGNVQMDGVYHIGFRIRNTGQVGLELSLHQHGTPDPEFSFSSTYTVVVPHIVAVPNDPDNSNDFVFYVRYHPLTVLGPRSMTLRIHSNDSVRNPFLLTLQGNVVASQMAVEAASGAPLAWNDAVSYGNVTPGASESRTFTIRNTGAAELLNVGASLTGDTAHYAITQAPAAVVPAGGSTTVTVAFAPTAARAFGAQLMINNSVRPFPLNLQGVGYGPELVVLPYPPVGLELLNDFMVTLSDTQVNGGGSGRSFQLANVGTAPLTGVTLTVTGDHSGDFTPVPALPAQLAAGQVVTFGANFRPTATGTRTATLTLTSNDVDESTFRIHLTGQGINPDLVVEDLAQVEIPNGTPHDFGAVEVRGAKKSRYVRLWNRGAGPLVIEYLFLDGAPQGDYFIGVPATPFEIAAGQYQQVEMGFDPASTGVKDIEFVIRSNDQDEPRFELPLTGTGIQPQMVVEKADGSPIAHQQAQGYGIVAVGTDSDLTFTLKNPGTAPLTTQLSLVGPQAALFSLQSHPLQTVYPGEAKTVTVRYRPSQVGTHQATLRIASNLGLADPDPLFDIPLTGTGEKTTVSWAAPSYTVAHDATSVTLTLTRTPANIPASVGLHFVGGIVASPPYFDAVAGIDYTPLTGPETTVTFAAGQAQKTVVVPLLAPAARAHINRAFGVAIFKVTGSTHFVDLAQANGVVVKIAAADADKPALQILTPAAAAKFSVTSPTITVTAKASDSQGIDRVEVSLNGGSPRLATATPPTLTSNGIYSLDITPVNGPNQITVTAFDPKGNSTSLSRSFTYQRRRSITLFAHELYTPATPPTAAITVNGATVHLSSEALGGVVKPASVLPGTQFKLVCAPRLPHVFDQWSLQPIPTDLQISGNTCTFTMPDADLVIRALTVPTPFIPRAGGTNRLHLMLDDDPNDGPGSSYKAHLSGTITTAGTFTGKLLIAGQTVALTAAIQTRSQALFTVAGKKQDYLTVPGGTLRIFPSDFEGYPFRAILTPTDASLPGLGQGTWATGYASWAIHSATHHVHEGLLNQGSRGLITVSFAPPAGPPALLPQGHGYASVSLTNTGVVTLAGVLADGTTITQSSDLVAENSALLFVQIRTPGAAATVKGGLLIGHLECTPTGDNLIPHQPANLSAALRWYLPAAASPKVLLYPQGWPEGVTLNATGAKYDPRLTYNAGLALAATTTASVPNAALGFTGGGFTDKLISNLNLTKFTVTKIPAGDASYTLTISAATGLFSGTFTPPAGAPAGTGKPAFRGILLNRVPYQFGRGFFLNHATPAKATHAGAVSLGAP